MLFIYIYVSFLLLLLLLLLLFGLAMATFTGRINQCLLTTATQISMGFIQSRFPSILNRNPLPCPPSGDNPSSTSLFLSSHSAPISPPNAQLENWPKWASENWRRPFPIPGIGGYNRQ